MLTKKALKRRVAIDRTADGIEEKERAQSSHFGIFWGMRGEGDGVPSNRSMSNGHVIKVWLANIFCLGRSL